jgi:phosphate-selective porin OprO/OprP
VIPTPEQPGPAPSPAAPEVGLTNARPQITSADGSFRFALRGIAQFDAADYDVKPLTSANDLASGTNIRRARLGFDATAFRDWNFSLWGEFGGSGAEAAALNQAFVEYAGFKPFSWADPVRFRAGAWATPAGLEDATANTEELFLERAAVEEMVRGLDAGDGREGVGVFATGKRWYLSGVFTGKVAGATAGVYNQQEGFLARGAFDLLHGKDYDVHIGGAVQGVIKPADTVAGPLTGYSITLAQQPELRVDSNSTKLVSTGVIAADGETTYSGEAGASLRNFYVAGEYYKLDVDRTAVGTTASPFNPSFSGWYVQGAWTLTGERHVWSSSNGGFRGIYQPLHPFDPKSGGWGAWEIAARYSVLDLDDDAGAAGAAAPLGGIRGGVQKITTVGVNWYPNSVLRFLFDYQHGNVERLSATGGDLGETLNDLSFRAQFAF